MDVQYLGNLFIRKSFYLAKDDDVPKCLRQLTQSRFDPFAYFSLSGVVIRRIPRVSQSGTNAEARTIFLRFAGRIDGDLLFFMTRPPATLIGRLMNSDAIKPSAQARFAVEAANAAEYLDKNFLRSE